jgi:hypothetical protein
MPPKFRLTNYFSIDYGLFTEIFCNELNHSMKFLNVYKPSVGKVEFWEKLFGFNFIVDDNIIIGGDLKFIVNKDEVLGKMGREEKLSSYFVDKMETKKLVDVEPKLKRLRWYCNRSRDEGIHKILDIFFSSRNSDTRG